LSETCYEFEDALNIYISSKGDKLWVINYG
jgi:hypothetical protein